MKCILIKISFILSLVFNCFLAFSQGINPHTGYVIVQETSFSKGGTIGLDSIFLTENYLFKKAHYVLFDVISPQSIITFWDFKTDSVYSIFDFPENISNEENTIKSDVFAEMINGKYFIFGNLVNRSNCSDSIIYSDKYKNINGFKSRQVLLINIDSISKKPDTTIAFVSQEINNKIISCLQGLVLESESSKKKLKTISIMRVKLPQDMNSVLKNCKDMKELERVINGVRIMHPDLLPTEEEIHEKAKEIYED